MSIRHKNIYQMVIDHTGIGLIVLIIAFGFWFISLIPVRGSLVHHLETTISGDLPLPD